MKKNSCAAELVGYQEAEDLAGNQRRVSGNPKKKKV